MTFDSDNIIFDFGGVLINVDYNLSINAFKSLGIDKFEEHFSQADQSNLFDDFETGKISPQFFINQLLPYLSVGTTPNQVVHAWNAMVLGIHLENIKLLEKLKANGKRIFLLSNTNEIHIKLAFDRWYKLAVTPPEELFEKIYLSHLIGMRKPEPTTFSYVCEQSGLIPQETLFIDDSNQHIEGARSIGLQTYHLTNIDQLHTIFPDTIR